MRFHLLLGCTLIAAWVSNSSGQETQTQPEWGIEGLATTFRQEQKAPAVSIAVGHHDQVVYAEAFGRSDLENAVSATEQTLFRTASIAKPMTAVAIMQLIDQGKIGLDDPIQKHCPEFAPTDKPLTVRHLLCHQGGVRHYKYPDEASGTKHYSSIKDSLELFKDDPLLFEPGTKYSYTTYGYSLLGRAVETASDMTFGDYLDEHLFRVAGMENAGVDDTFRIIPNRARGYQLITVSQYFSLPVDQPKSVKVGQLLNCQLHDTSMKVPGGGLICSPTDLVRFGQAMLADRLISKASRQIAWKPQQTNDGRRTRYGLGWSVTRQDETEVIGHSGGQAGTSTMLMIFPQHDVVVAVMCNLRGAPCSNLASQVAKAYIDSL